MIRQRLFATLIILYSAGCSLAPDYERPVIPLGEKYEGPVIQGESAANLQWWDLFKDPALQSLIRQTLNENRNLQIMLARVAEARALVGYVRADQFPFVDISASAGRSAAGSAVGYVGPVNDFGAFADLSFEVDLWAKLYNATEAQQRLLISEQYTQNSVVISLVAQTAQLYFTLVDLDTRIAIAERTLANRRESTRLIRARFSQVIIPELDVNQAEIEEGDAQASLATLERDRRLVINALQTLSGRAYGQIERRPSLEGSIMLYELPPGVPAVLLQRRPDIMAAEEVIRAEYASIGVAEAQRLPSI